MPVSLTTQPAPCWLIDFGGGMDPCVRWAFIQLHMLWPWNDSKRWLKEKTYAIVAHDRTLNYERRAQLPKVTNRGMYEEVA